MTTPPRHGVYRAFINLYPPTFRRHYREDLVQHFDDLIVDRGMRSACLRTALDLVITVPNYRLERIVSQQHSATTLVVIISLVAAAGVISLLTGVYSGLALLGAATVLALAQRNALAKALRTPVAGLRRRRLRISAALAVVFVFCAGIYAMVIGDTWTLRETVLAGVGTVAMISAPVFLVVGLLTPKADPHLVG
jgi:uncharacterized membrane protein